MTKNGCDITVNIHVHICMVNLGYLNVKDRVQRIFIKTSQFVCPIIQTCSFFVDLLPLTNRLDNNIFKLN